METCTLRKWLNEDNPYHGTEGGNPTNDKEYVPSLSDVLNPLYGLLKVKSLKRKNVLFPRPFLSAGWKEKDMGKVE